MLDEAIDALFDLTPAIRYVACGSGQEVVMREREGLGGASSSDSDRYEELLVPLPRGHVSIAFELDSDPIAYVPVVAEILRVD